jgi:predicted GNAT family N-acyltransferase
MDPVIQIQSWLNAKKEAFSIRKAVFIDGQGIPEAMELDEFDPIAEHALAYQGGHCIGTARLIVLSDQEGRIGRMAVLPAFRKQGIGGQLLRALLESSKTQGLIRLTLHAQLSAIPFYEQFGFVAQGDIYDEVGIAHRDMMLLI